MLLFIYIHTPINVYTNERTNTTLSLELDYNCWKALRGKKKNSKLENKKKKNQAIRLLIILSKGQVKRAWN